MTGTVEEVALRVTRIRDPSGVVWYVRNGEILRVGNLSQTWSRAVLDIASPGGRERLLPQRAFRHGEMLFVVGAFDGREGNFHALA